MIDLVGPFFVRTPLSVPVEGPGGVAFGFFDAPGQTPDGVGLAVQLTEPQLHLATADVARLELTLQATVTVGAVGAAAVAVDSPTYRVRRLLPMDDGQVTAVVLVEASA